MTIDVLPKRTIRKEIDEKAASGVCLHCSEEAFRRGLCGKHHHEFRMALLDKPKAERGAWEADQIHEGRILPERYSLTIQRNRVFGSEE